MPAETSTSENPKELEGVTVTAGFKKPAKWLIIAAGAVVAIALIYFLTKQNKTT